LTAATSVQAATAVKIAIPSIGANALSSSMIKLTTIETTAHTIKIIIVRSFKASKHKAQKVFGGLYLNEFLPYFSCLIATSSSLIPYTGLTHNPSRIHLLPPLAIK
jgi:hypothetical protein